MKTTRTQYLIAAALVGALAWPASAQEVLPFPPKPSGSIAGRTLKESVYSPLPETKRLHKADSTNILIVLIDDIGPGQCATPTAD